MKVLILLGQKPMSDYQYPLDQWGTREQAISSLYQVLKSKIPNEDLAIEDPASLPSIAKALEELDVGLTGYDLRDFEAGIEAMRHFEPAMV
jgi:hypothetical protein